MKSESRSREPYEAVDRGPLKGPFKRRRHVRHVARSACGVRHFEQRPAAADRETLPAALLCLRLLAEVAALLVARDVGLVAPDHSRLYTFSWNVLWVGYYGLGYD